MVQQVQGDPGAGLDGPTGPTGPTLLQNAATWNLYL